MEPQRVNVPAAQLARFDDLCTYIFVDKWWGASELCKKFQVNFSPPANVNFDNIVEIIRLHVNSQPEITLTAMLQSEDFQQLLPLDPTDEVNWLRLVLMYIHVTHSGSTVIIKAVPELGPAHYGMFARRQLRAARVVRLHQAITATIPPARPLDAEAYGAMPPQFDYSLSQDQPYVDLEIIAGPIRFYNVRRSHHSSSPP